MNRRFGAPYRASRRPLHRAASWVATRKILRPRGGIGRVFFCFKGGFVMLEFKYDTQLLIDGKGLDEDRINAYIT